MTRIELSVKGSGLHIHLSNTLMRLENSNDLGDVKGSKDAVDDTGKGVCLVKLHVRETSKVRNERTIVVRGGEY